MSSERRSSYLLPLVSELSSAKVKELIRRGSYIKLNPVSGLDTMMRDGVSTSISTRHQNICVMREYEDMSFEEIRFEDYLLEGKEGICNMISENTSLQTGTSISDTSRTATNFIVAQNVHEFLQGFKRMLLNGKYSDFIISVKGKEFKVHKIILATHSPVFAAMMEHDTKEKDTGKVNIDDSEPDVFSGFLDFLYTAKIDNFNSDNILDLYRVADKYQVTELCNVCVKYMMNNISSESFCDIMTLALQHQERELIEMASQFFVYNSKEIATTAKWGTFLMENPVVCNELFLKALSLNKQ